MHDLDPEDRIACFTGATSTDRREELKRRFNADPATDPLRILICTDAAREGINLQARCHDLIHIDLPWNPARLEQRNGRIDRHGQRQPQVHIFHFVGQGYHQRSRLAQDANPGDLEGDLEFLLRAARKVETIGRDRVIVYDASVTTCTQPVPHWSFAVSKAKIKIEGYAHLFNLRPKIKKVPFFYLPYLAWPVKRDRAPGLLFPEFGTTNNRGETVSIPVFVPLGASADVTFFGEYYTIAGWGGEIEYFLPRRDDATT